MHLLYIDPGTGSMLFSIMIGAAATLYFLFRALVIKAKLFFAAGKGGGASLSGGAESCVIYCEGRQYWGVFKPILDAFEAQKKRLVYFTSAEDDPVFTAGYQYVQSEYIGEGNRAFARLNLLQARIVLMTTPGLDVYQLKRSKGVSHYAHVLHAPSDATMYKLFGLDYFDSVLLTGDYQAKDIRTLEKERGLLPKKLITAGCTYLDVYNDKIKTLQPEEHHPFTVLVSPSWGPQSLLNKYGEKLLVPLAQSGWRVIVRPHPQSAKNESVMLTALAEKFKENQNIEWDYERENVYSLSKSDIMISDFSGIIFDYTFLFDRPVIYVNQGLDLRPYDADDICWEHSEVKGVSANGNLNKLWQFSSLSAFGILPGSSRRCRITAR